MYRTHAYTYTYVRMYVYMCVIKKLGETLPSLIRQGRVFSLLFENNACTHRHAGALARYCVGAPAHRRIVAPARWRAGALSRWRTGALMRCLPQAAVQPLLQSISRAAAS